MINREQEELLSPAEAGQRWTKAAAYLSSLDGEYLVNFLMEAYMNDPDILPNLKAAIIIFEEGLADCAEDF